MKILQKLKVLSLVKICQKAQNMCVKQEAIRHMVFSSASCKNEAIFHPVNKLLLQKGKAT
jgi:hypothetical protein